MAKKEEKKEKVYSIEDELLNETESTDVDITDPTDKPKPKKKF